MTEKEIERAKGLLISSHNWLTGGAAFQVPFEDKNKNPPEILDWRKQGISYIALDSKYFFLVSLSDYRKLKDN